MNKADFTFDKITSDDGFVDIWFKVDGETKKELTDRYMEQSMIEVLGTVYGTTDGRIGVKRLFPFYFDVIMVIDSELSQMMADIIQEKNLLP